MEARKVVLTPYIHLYLTLNENYNMRSYTEDSDSLAIIFKNGDQAIEQHNFENDNYVQAVIEPVTEENLSIDGMSTNELEIYSRLLPYQDSVEYENNVSKAGAAIFKLGQCTPATSERYLVYKVRGTNKFDIEFCVCSLNNSNNLSNQWNSINLFAEEFGNKKFTLADFYSFHKGKSHEMIEFILAFLLREKIISHSKSNSRSYEMDDFSIAMEGLSRDIEESISI